MSKASSTTIDNIRNTIEEKGENLKISDFLKPELEMIIANAVLSEDDRIFATMYFIEGKKATEVMEAVCWYSTNTFTRHKKKTIAKLLETARIMSTRKW